MIRTSPCFTILLEIINILRRKECCNCAKLLLSDCHNNQNKIEQGENTRTISPKDIRVTNQQEAMRL